MIRTGRHMSHRLWGIVAIALAMSTRPANAQAKADSVSLRFAWPVGMTAHVDQESSRVQVSPQRRDSIGVRSRYRLTVSAHPKGRLIQSDSFVVTSASSGRAGTVDPQQLYARLGSVQPSYVVTTDGEFVGLEGIERTKRVLDEILAPLRREMADAPPELKALMESATSPQALTATAAQDWNALAGTWVGANWEVGAAYESSTEEPSPIIPGLVIPMRQEFSAAERVPCYGDETAHRCVRLEMVSVADSAALRRIISEFITKVAPKTATALAGLQSMRSLNRLTVIVDPRDLRPYAMTLVRQVDAEVLGPGGPGGRATRVDTRSARYTYTP